jgi:hypothetical protein
VRIFLQYDMAIDAEFIPLPNLGFNPVGDVPSFIFIATDQAVEVNTQV